MWLKIGLAALTLLALAATLAYRDEPRLFGFAPASARSQRTLEQRFLSEPDAARIRAAHRQLTSRPHPAGSPRDRELADWIAQQFRNAGMEDVELTTHEILLPEAGEVTIEMTQPRQWHATSREPPMEVDADTAIDSATAGVPFHAYSASGSIDALVVYAGDGEAADYEWLSITASTCAERSRSCDTRRLTVIVAPRRWRRSSAAPRAV